jgi:hypothetical protein
LNHENTKVTKGTKLKNEEYEDARGGGVEESAVAWGF